PMSPPEASPGMLQAARNAVLLEKQPQNVFLMKQGISHHSGSVWAALTDETAREMAFLTDSGELVDVPGGWESDADAAASAIDKEGEVWVSAAGHTARPRPLDRPARMRHRLAALQPAAAAETSPEARTPMPG